MVSINDLAMAAIASTSAAGDKTASEGGAATTRGAFVVLEGLDRSGKTTQVKLLEQRFVEEGRPVKVMRFPDRTTPIGQMIDAYLKSDVKMDDHVIHLLFSANRWEAVSQIQSLLASGTTILCDRYYHSGIVYSAAKQNPSLNLSWARAPERGLPRPDLVLFLDLDETQAKARGGWGGEVYEQAEIQKRVRELFWGLSMGGKDLRADEGLVDGAGGLEGAQWKQEEEDLVVVDAGSSVEEVAEEIWGKVKGRVELVDRGEVGKVVRVVR
ncbi:thymidylate kinase-domain-containing protein [Dactylonectria estremocensis]|uniref:Thymidylate kinase n=1 Tax=Dactylonectria estremocensis TaxID=1079267 RepID=A0A9P9FCG7_9HYPO|nr:thymidylate kinase-domain-containing protein [Dactylonectria estremocensis]